MLLEGKRAVVVGVADRDSIAWHIAQRFKEEGARVDFLVLPRMLEKVESSQPKWTAASAFRKVRI